MFKKLLTDFKVTNVVICNMPFMLIFFSLTVWASVKNNLKESPHQQKAAKINKQSSDIRDKHSSGQEFELFITIFEDVIYLPNKLKTLNEVNQVNQVEADKRNSI